jgi:uncharacterized protein YbjT (DUF2867 family)
MRIAITGATGNVGAALVAALAADSAVDELVGVARRPPGESFPLTRFVQADIADDDLAVAFAGADAVVHLAWEIQPSPAQAPLAHERARDEARPRRRRRGRHDALRRGVVGRRLRARAEGPPWSTRTGRERRSRRPPTASTR